MNLIELKTASGELLLVNPDAIVAVYPKGTRASPQVRFVTGQEETIDEPSYQSLRGGLTLAGE